MMPSKLQTKKSVLLLSAVLSTLGVFSQGLNNKWDIFGNSNITSTTNFLGHNNNFPLNLKTIAAQPINLFTGNTQRMTILGTTGFVGTPNI